MTDTCNCGARLVPSVRYDATGPHETLACFEGREACSREPARIGRPPTAREPYTCELCGGPRERSYTRYCSRWCYGASKAVPRVPVVCPCGTTFEVRELARARGRGKFCSTACSDRWRRKHTLSVGLAS
jgi:hypothetical protein